MVFSSTIFLCVFLPAVCLLNWLAPGIHAKNVLLVAASLLFYAFGNPSYVLLLLVSVLCNYTAGLYVSRSTGAGRAAMAAAVAVNLGILAFYKYLGFLAQNLNLLPGVELPVPQILLPVGISFFTFQGMSYVIDVYRDTSLRNRSFFQVLLYICLFPQLVAGPIVKYRDVAREIEARRCTLAEAAQGIRRFILGLTKKLLIADVMAEVVTVVFGLEAAQLDVRVAWLGALAYTLQIYFDFSGYSDMAIGLGWIFGFHFKENFDHPYTSDSIQMFWRRWHISLSSWFRDYLYIPLGGNRKGKLRTYLNKYIVFFCTGLWHGASWNYVLWGLWHGTFLVAEDTVLPVKRLKGRARWLGHLYTMLVVVLGFVLFRAADLRQAGIMFQAMFAGFRFTVESGAAWAQITDRLHLSALLLGAVASLPILSYGRKAADRYPLLEKLSYPAVLALYLVDLLHLSAASYVPFIYFQF